jgi:serine protease
VAATLALLSGAALSAETGPPLRAAALATAAADSSGGARVIVKFRTGSSVGNTVQALSVNSTNNATSTTSSRSGPQPLAQAQTLSRRHGLALADGRTIGPLTQVVFGSGLSSAALAAQLASDPDVEYAEVDRRVHALAAPSDPLYANGLTANSPVTTPVVGQWYLRSSTETPAALNAETAWNVTTGSASVVVAVLDTGVRPDHPDLAGKLLAGYDFVHDPAYANDGDGWDADPSDPGDWVTDAENASGTFKGCGASNSSWHGTQTTGLVGASTNNGIGMASVGRNVMVLPVRVLGKCGGYDSDVLAAMQWAAGLSVAGVPANANPARVISLSLGAAGACTSSYSTVISQLTSLGINVVVAAGNDGLAVDEPANCPGVIAVAGIRHSGTKVGYSNLGPEVALGAPAGNCVNTSGTCVYPVITTTNTGTTVPATNTYSDGNTRPSLGTSFSAPLVSGTVGLMLSANPTLTPAQVKSLLQSSARPYPATGAGTGVAACQAPSATAQGSECYCTTTTCGAGMLDAGAAVQAAAANAIVARIALGASVVTVGDAVQLSGSTSAAASGQTISSYAWTVTNGSGTATFTSAVNGATATLKAATAGTVTVALAVTDSLGNQATTSQVITINAPGGTTPSGVGSTSGTPTSSGGGGGGAFDLGWALLAALAVAAGVASRRARRRGH